MPGLDISLPVVTDSVCHFLEVLCGRKNTGERLSVKSNRSPRCPLGHVPFSQLRQGNYPRMGVIPDARKNGIRRFQM